MNKQTIFIRQKGSAYKCECGKMVYCYRKKEHLNTFYHLSRLEKQKWVRDVSNNILSKII